MIAKSAFLILGMINESPKGAYEINKLLGQMNLKWWLKLADSTVYVTTRNLETKGYIIGHSEQNGNMPERTVYTITDAGNSILKASLREAFKTMDFDTTTFSVAMLYMYALEEAELTELFAHRKKILEEYLIGIEQNMKALEGHVEAHILMDIERMKHIIEVELSSICSFSSSNLI